jgi:hypothetical protein
MTRVVAKKFRKRIAVMHELRTCVLSQPNLAQLVLSDCPPPATTSLPSWWHNNHDLNLLQGIGRHGIGQWQEIFADPDMDWSDALEIRANPARSEPLFNRARQLIKLYSALWPHKTVGPFDIQPEDYVDPPELTGDQNKRRRSYDESDAEEQAPKVIRISKSSMTIIHDK